MGIVIHGKEKEMINQPVLDLFLKYAAADSKSGVNKEDHPTSPGQTQMIEMIRSDLLEGGVQESQIYKLADGSLLVSFTGTRPGKQVCYAAHVDTSPDAPGGAHCIVHDYQSGDITLPEGGTVIPAEDLQGKEGKTIVTASGTTTLGADDKAGVAVLVQICRELASGKIFDYPSTYFWFCVDEEIGQLEISMVPTYIVDSWDAIITLDGGDPREVDTDCFCGWETIVDFFGQSAHPGVEGKKLKPAHYALASMIDEISRTLFAPWETKEKESFVYVAEIERVDANRTTAKIYPRSFDPKELRDYHKEIVEIAEQAAENYGVRYEISGKGLMYVGTGTAIQKAPQILEPIMAAVTAVTGEARENAVRGGTDGAMINMSHPDLPAPNIGVGMYNFHGVREFLVVEEMVQAYEIMCLLFQAYIATA